MQVKNIFKKFIFYQVIFTFVLIIISSNITVVSFLTFNNDAKASEIFTLEVVINEVMSSNGETLRDWEGDYSDWIEIYNPSALPIDISGYYLSDNLADPLKWTFPSNSLIIGKGHMVIWASGKDTVGITGEIHTNFSISREGEYLMLTSPDKASVVDMLDPVFIPRDFSYGRHPDGSDNWEFFDKNNASPGKTNNRAQVSSGITNSNLNPVFSKKGGFFTSDFILSISGNSNSEIYYTTDGSEPTRDSVKYTDPLVIRPSSVLPGQIVQIIEKGVMPKYPISYINVTPQEAADMMQWHKPEKEIFKATIVRARAYSENGDISEIITHSYFIDGRINSRYTFPVISLTMDIDDLFGYENGIYVPGKVYYDKGYGDSYWGTPNANYHQRGRDWERPVFVEFFEPGGQLGFSINAGIRIHGSGTKVLPQKSLRLYARKDYDIRDSFAYDIFQGAKKTGTDESLTDFKRLVLRNGGQDFYRTIFKDMFLQSLIEHESIDTQASRPAIVFMNGEYWGIQVIRERFDLHYLALNYNADPENFVMVISTGSLDHGEPGDEKHFKNMVDFVKSNDMSTQENYDYIKTQMDVDNYINYVAFQMNIGNHDWPSNNVNAWRYKSEYNTKAPYGLDGRWRWMIFDLDYGYGFKDVSYNSLNNILLTEEEGSDKPDWSTHLFRGLIKNEEFKALFINTMADQLNTIVKTERVLESVNYHEELFMPEIQEHIDRWTKYPRPNLNDWKSYVDRLRNYARARTENMHKHIDESFSTGEPVNLTLDVADGEMGFLRVNSININEDTKGVGHNIYPWTGKYFRNIPVKITAVPKPGYKFSGWVKNEGFDPDTSLDGQLINDDETPGNIEYSTEPVILANLQADTVISAKFEVDPDYSDEITEPDSQLTPEPSESSDISETDELDGSYPNGMVIIIFGVSAILLVAVLVKGL